MIQLGNNSFIEYTYSASGEKLRVTYGVRQQPYGGVGKIRPWTKEEQEKAAQENEREKDIIECYQKEGW